MCADASYTSAQVRSTLANHLCNMERHIYVDAPTTLEVYIDIEQNILQRMQRMYRYM